MLRWVSFIGKCVRVRLSRVKFIKDRMVLKKNTCAKNVEELMRQRFPYVNIKNIHVTLNHNLHAVHVVIKVNTKAIFVVICVTYI